MNNSHLRIFDPQNNLNSPNPDAATQPRPPWQSSRTVTVRAGDVFPVLADALSTGKTWLNDFESDEITMPFDLYEVILAYQHYQRLSA